MIVVDGGALTGEDGRRGSREAGINPGVGGRLERHVQVAVADHVEQDHRLDLRQRHAALGAAARIVDVLGAAALAVGREVAVAASLLPVEEGDRDRRPGHRIGQRPRELEHDGDSGGAVVGAHEAGDPGLGVVMGADQDVAAAATRG